MFRIKTGDCEAASRLAPEKEENYEKMRKLRKEKMAFVGIYRILYGL